MMILDHETKFLTMATCMIYPSTSHDLTRSKRKHSSNDADQADAMMFDDAVIGETSEKRTKIGNSVMTKSK